MSFSKAFTDIIFLQLLFFWRLFFLVQIKTSFIKYQAIIKKMVLVLYNFQTTICNSIIVPI